MRRPLPTTPSSAFAIPVFALGSWTLVYIWLLTRLWHHAAQANATEEDPLIVVGQLRFLSGPTSLALLAVSLVLIALAFVRKPIDPDVPSMRLAARIARAFCVVLALGFQYTAIRGYIPFVDKWRFHDPPETQVVTTRQVLEGAPVLAVYRAEDGRYAFVCGTTNDPADRRRATLGGMIEVDYTLKSMTRLGPGMRARRPDEDASFETENVRR